MGGSVLVQNASTHGDPQPKKGGLKTGRGGGDEETGRGVWCVGLCLAGLFSLQSCLSEASASSSVVLGDIDGRAVLFPNDCLSRLK